MFLNNKIFGSFDGAFGLDLSDLSIKVVELEQKGKKQSIRSFGVAPIAPGAVSDGEIQNKEQVADAIKKVLATCGPKKIKTKKVICSLPETKAFLRIISIPQMDAKEIKEAVKWEMEANIPLTLDQVYYDWQLLKDGITGEKGKIDLLVVAVAKNTVDQFIETLEYAGLEPIGMDIESVAQSRSLLNQDEQKKSSLVVDVGDRRTSFVLANGIIPCFTSSIPLSGTSLTDAISKGLNISLEQAEKTKISYGIGDDYKNDVIFKSVKPVLENFVSEIERTTDFYLSSLHYSSDIEKIIICGGGSNTKGLVPFLSKRLGKQIIMGDPWVNVDFGKELPVIEKTSATQYTTAVGLALKALEYEDLY